MKKLQVSIDENIQICEILGETYQYELADEVMDNRWKMFASPGDVSRLVVETQQRLEDQRVAFKNANLRYVVLFTLFDLGFWVIFGDFWFGFWRGFWCGIVRVF